MLDFRFKYMYFYLMRSSQTPEQRERGKRLGSELRRERQRKDMKIGACATEADISVDTLRSIESGRIASPGFFIVATLARLLELNLDELAERVHDQPRRGDR
jgi:transcriptional regulator with XRE-family HTH domain